ncbi:TPA: hypothetical protein QCU10_005826 [Bacillus anthracis]|nr:hypothetical protein [Bacillus cereus biovar anthracis]HDR6230946.1 hypothetical protein [Bacillus cereus biovar anthracis]HDR6240473.1 hypothetical protein [Bacillus cereus biovar anthracis]HDR6252417.1 hypothetical protein [Bacillus cereus biovar anthracis]HDR6254202.1 hypothetical protein [Bacillus cereus biovar anthracis]
MSIKDAYIQAKHDGVQSLVIVVEILLSYGKVSLHDDISTLTPFLEVNSEKWNRLIQKEFMKRGYVA